jgi:RNA polymerase sigma-70 factor (ECF subfamily)
VSADETQGAIRAAYRKEAARLIARLTRIVRDVGLAEELAQDTLVAALEHWPETGVPDNPAAWLMATAQRRAIDELRRSKRQERRYEALGYELQAKEKHVPDFETAVDDDIGDDLLRLVFTSCHPALSTEARVALTLRLLGGLTTEEIARAFLSSEATVAQRIVRAKRTLADAQIPFEVPRGPELAARLASVLEVVYLIFNEGYSATAGDDVLRPALCDEAIRLGASLTALAPHTPEVHGLYALMELQRARQNARLDASGAPIALADQDRSRWDGERVARGLAALQQAEALGGSEGAYALQAAIAACHARAHTAEETDWNRIVSLYATLSRVQPSPVVEMNCAVALSMVHGPSAALERIDALRSDPAIQGYHLFHLVRGDLLYKLLRFEEAAAELAHAAQLTRNVREQEALLARADECAQLSEQMPSA